MPREIPIASVRAAKAKAKEIFSRWGEVNGVGLARAAGGYVLKVNLAKAPALDADLPREIDGVPVRVEVVGPLHRRGS